MRKIIKYIKYSPVYLRDELKLIRAAKFNSLYVAAGMPRSGSTLFFNIIRIILNEKYSDKISSRWISELQNGKDYSNLLVKTHNITPVCCYRKKLLFYSYRDIRDVLVSGMRKFGNAPDRQTVDSYMRHYRIARKHADLVMPYEKLTCNRDEVIADVIRMVDVDVDVSSISKALIDLEQGASDGAKHSSETLLHRNHLTHTKAGEWQHLLPEEIIDYLNVTYKWWFDECGYLVE